jgi:kynurenine formamidase
MAIFRDSLCLTAGAHTSTGLRYNLIVDLIDLSQPLTTGMQVYPGDPEVALADATDFERDGYRVSAMHLGTHAGTHVDAPWHACLDGLAVDEVELSRFCGQARIVRLRCDDSTPVRLEAVRSQLADLADTQVVLFETGWSTYFGTDRYLRHPYLDPAVAEYVLASGVMAIGLDALSPDATSGADPGTDHFAVHKVVLGAGGVIFENLAHLSAVTWARPWFAAFPLRIAGRDGSPVRAVMFNAPP